MINYNEVKNKLDDVGCGFCLAKWTQVTIHLLNGTTHSCHHPIPHKIPLEELKRNPSALHNTQFKKEQRKTMLEGGRPKECEYCWNVEDSSSSFSDRVLKSSEPWSMDQYETIKNLDWREDYNPRYLEISFGNTCNLKCAYCSPPYSSKWVEEIKKFGPYTQNHNYNSLDFVDNRVDTRYKLTDENPYTNAFWEWWPDLYKDLHTFRITGGEPLLMDDTFKVLEYIQENWEVNPNLCLAINTNLSVPRNLIDKLITIVKDLTENNKVRELIIFTSIEATGKDAEYIRFGLDYEQIWKNIHDILDQLPKVVINIMATFNALSVFTYGDLIDKVFEFKKKFHNDVRYWGEALLLDTSYLRYPSFLTVNILEPKFKELILEASKKAMYYGKFENTYGFSDIQIQKIKRTYDYAIKSNHNNDVYLKKQFVKYVTEYDKRRGTDFKKTFPQLIEFYDKYKD
jgi:organic radical activating enzyme